MKNIVSYLLTAALLLTLTACGGAAAADAPGSAGELNVYTWQDYVPPTVVERFEEETGIRINYSYFSTNEEMLAKLQATGGSQYDIVLCTDYIIDLALQNDDLFQPLDLDRISNYGNIDPRFLGHFYDPDNEYVIPYWISSGAIVYDPARTDLTFESFADLADPSLAGNVAIVDEPGIINVILRTLGYEYNETDPDIIYQSQDFLDRLRPNIKAFNTDSPQDLVVNGDAIASFQTGAQATAALEKDPSLVVSYPAEGGDLINIDGFVLPKEAPHLDNAYIFLDYMLQPEIAALATQWTHYHNSNLYFQELIADDIDASLVAIIPDELLENAAMFENLGDAQRIYDQLWTEFK